MRRGELLRMAADLARDGEPFVLAMVVRRLPASSSQAGDMAIVTGAGTFHGWLGGSCTQPVVVREARAALADGRPRLLCLAPAAAEAGLGRGERPDATSDLMTDDLMTNDRMTNDRMTNGGITILPMTCASGGTVEIYLDPVLPEPCLAVFGASATARALARLGEAMGYRIVAVEPAAVAGPAPLPGGAWRGPRFAVVATMGEGDTEAIRAALAWAPDYLGVVASARRFAEMRELLVASGIAAEALGRIKSPAGLDIGARTPEEIAVSVLAEIVELRRKAGAAPVFEAATTATPATTAIDPICGMTVEIAGARHRAQHAGRTWYFCCGGCRERFLAAPERALTAMAAAGAGSGGRA